jgi:predicted AAA+ superfamily ATPase
LQSERDRAKLTQPELYLADHQDRLVILDEVHRVPGLFAVLRGQIDQMRRAGKRAGMYLLLGSASIDLLKQSGETLAGRISYLHLDPINVAELPPTISQDTLWQRGGFPDSLLARSNALSLRWRLDFIRTYLERDVPQFGPRISPQVLRRYWGMLAHSQGGLLNTAQLARNLGVDNKTATSYLDLMDGLLLVRRLLPWHSNAGKRLTKSPKVYVRDSGICHALLDIADKEALLGHPVVGASWEGFAIENLLSNAPEGVQSYFYRSSGGAEVDLLLLWPSGKVWVIEIKRSLTPKVERGFHSACEDLVVQHPDLHKWLVYPGAEDYPVHADIKVVSLTSLIAKLQMQLN